MTVDTEQISSSSLDKTVSTNHIRVVLVHHLPRSLEIALFSNLNIAYQYSAHQVPVKTQ